MKADLSLIISHDGGRWRARGDGVQAEGRTLAELDAHLRAGLRGGGAKRRPGQRVTVFMGFDFDTLPAWLRQYSAHYFNRTVVIDL